MKILFVGYRDERHSKFGGYDYIAHYPNTDFLNASKLPFGFVPVGKSGKKINILFLDFYARKQANKYDVIHYFYSDFMLFKKLPEKRHCKFVATVHMKTESFSQKQITILKSFDKVICLSSSEERALKEKGVNAFFIPHGFNKPVFNFKRSVNFDDSKINLFYSGMNYRDFSTFLKIAKFSENEKLNVQFYAVGQSDEYKKNLAHCKNVCVCPRLSDDEYYSLLASCDYNFLPLTFATANNALLEAQFLGVVSILPQIQGVTDYADGKKNIFYTDFSDLKGQFSKLAKQIQKNELISFSEKFCWKEIYKELEKVYESN